MFHYRPVPPRSSRYFQDRARFQVQTSSFQYAIGVGSLPCCQEIWDRSQRQKRCIILDRKPYRYQKFISDIAGQDIHSHDGKTAKLISEIASWLREEFPESIVPGGTAIAAEFKSFVKDVPQICAVKRLDPGELTFQDYRKMAEKWIIAASRP